MANISTLKRRKEAFLPHIQIDARLLAYAPADIEKQKEK